MLVVAEPASAVSFKALVDLLCSLDDRAAPIFTWSWVTEGLSIKQLVDSATVFVDIITDSFSSYKIERPVNMGVSIKSLQRILSSVGKTDEIRLEYADENTNVLSVRVLSKNQTSCVYDLQLVFVEDDSVVEVPENMAVSKITLPTAMLSHIIKSFQTIDAKFVDIKQKADCLEFVAESMMCTGRYMVPHANGGTEEETRMSIGRLRFVHKLAALAVTLDIGFKHDTSLHVTAQSAELKMQFIVGAICRQADIMD